MNIDYFLEIYGHLPRAGPGSRECTKRAYDMMDGLPECPRILDLGCGPGAQTVDLLQISGGHVVALDFLPLMLERTKSKAEQANVAQKLEMLEQDMNQMRFAPASFDVVWSEGAIYNLGFERGLKTIRSIVRPGGFVAVSEVVWLKADPPARLVEFWRQYPEIASVTSKWEVISRLGYKSVGHFILPDRAWTAEYYDPMERLISEKQDPWSHIPEALKVLEEAKEEIAIFRKNSSYFGYAFFVMQRPLE
ncbi:MAG: class I SAM-dependent methyltransferase [Planctomycetaceae bacterium]|nr:class I SAM-dependent methyltransferase [Planctomycetaceae bacterium]